MALRSFGFHSLLLALALWQTWLYTWECHSCMPHDIQGRASKTKATQLLIRFSVSPNFGTLSQSAQRASQLASPMKNCWFLQAFGPRGTALKNSFPTGKPYRFRWTSLLWGSASQCWFIKPEEMKTPHCGPTKVCHCTNSLFETEPVTSVHVQTIENSLETLASFLNRLNTMILHETLWR